MKVKTPSEMRFCMMGEASQRDGPKVQEYSNALATAGRSHTLQQLGSPPVELQPDGKTAEIFDQNRLVKSLLSTNGVLFTFT